jgi:hypothetical protein
VEVIEPKTELEPFEPGLPVPFAPPEPIVTVIEEPRVIE